MKPGYRGKILIPLYIDGDMILWAICVLRFAKQKPTKKAILETIRSAAEGELSNGYFTGATDGCVDLYCEERYGDKHGDLPAEDLELAETLKREWTW
jgi:hypothetical protein